MATGEFRIVIDSLTDFQEQVMEQIMAYTREIAVGDDVVIVDGSIYHGENGKVVGIFAGSGKYRVRIRGKATPVHIWPADLRKINPSMYSPGRRPAPYRPNPLLDQLERDRARIREQRATLLRQEQQVVGKIRQAERWPSLADCESNAVIRFLKRFPGSPKAYAYAAIKADNGYWYLTSDNTCRKTDVQMMDFLLEGVERESLQVVQAWAGL